MTLTAHAHLARAYLAIADDPEPPVSQRSAARAACSLLAALVLAVAAPLAWTSAGKPLDLPAATTVKGTGSAEDDEDGDDDLGDPWAATHA